MYNSKLRFLCEAVFLSKKFKQKCICSTWPSPVVPHQSTTQARGSLTSLFGWEAVTLPDVAAYDFKVFSVVEEHSSTIWPAAFQNATRSYGSAYWDLKLALHGRVCEARGKKWAKHNYTTSSYHTHPWLIRYRHGMIPSQVFPSDPRSPASRRGDKPLHPRCLPASNRRRGSCPSS